MDRLQQGQDACFISTGIPAKGIGESLRQEIEARRIRSISRSCRLFLYVPFHGMLHQFPRAAQTKFFFDVRLVGLHRFYTEVENLSDLPRSMAFPDEAKHFQFPVSELRDR